jgi:outer membrane receptor for ferrienterochelin and colicin
MKLLTLSLGLLTAISWSTRAFADPGGDLETLLSEPVISTASKTAERSREAPGTSSIVTAEEIQRHGLRSLNEVINYASLGMITTNPLHSVEIGARGVLVNGDYGNHVLLLIDGHRVNEPWNGTAYFERGAGVPFEMIDHIEFVLGPGSVLYGSQAMLGVINIVTKRARAYSGVRLIAAGELATADFEGDDLGGAYRFSAGVGREFRLFGKAAELTLQAEYHRQDGPTFRFGPQVWGADSVSELPKTWTPGGEGTGIWGGRATEAYYAEAPAAYARLVVGDLRLTARASSYERSSPYLDSLVAPSGDFNEPRNAERDRFAAIGAQHDIVLSPIASLSSSVSGDLYDYRWRNRSTAAEDCLEGQTRGCERTLRGGAQWGGAEIQATLDWLRTGYLTTLVGADARLRRVTTDFDIVDRVTGAGAGAARASTRTDLSAAAYLQQTARPSTWLALNAGVRADRDPRFGAHFSPRVAGSIYPWRAGTLKLMYAEAFHGPEAYQLEYADPQSQIAAGGLKAETVRSAEASFEQRFRSHRWLFGVFRAWWNDLILANSLSEEAIAEAIARGELAQGTQEASQNQNASRIDNYGLVAAIDGSLLTRRLQYGLNLTSAYSRHRARGDTSRPLTVTPQFFGNARVSYDLSAGLPTLALAAQFSDRRPADRAYDGGHTPPAFAPPHLQLRLAASGRAPALPGLSYRVAVDYSFTREGPYAIGPNAWVYGAESTPAELSPVERARLVLGLQYLFEP